MGLMLGGAALWLGITKGPIGQWGFGAACLLLVPAALSVHGRIREGLGNRGLERERLTLRITSHLLRLLALGLAAASVLELSSHPFNDLTLESFGFSALAIGLLLGLWLAKRGLAEVHPTLELDGSRTRALLELAVLLLAGGLLGHWFFWANAITGFAMALRLFSEGQTLAKGSTLPPACGGCGSGCGCG
jgi:hypothetical protein